MESPDIRNASDLKAYYKSIEINNSSYFENAISVAKFDTGSEWSALCKPTNRAVWDMTADTVNVSTKSLVVGWKLELTNQRHTTIRQATRLYFRQESCKLPSSLVRKYRNILAMVHLALLADMSFPTVRC